MANNYFQMKAKMAAINKNLRKAHPDWSNQRIYAATKAIALGEGKADETVEETVAVETETVTE